MAKSSKKKNFVLYRNEVTPQPETEISGIDDMDKDRAKEHLEATKYVSIEKGLNPELFYDLAGILKGDTWKNVSKKYSVSQFHGVSIETLADAGFMVGSHADLLRGIVTTGIISLCVKGGVNDATVRNTLAKVAEMSSREQDNKDRLELLLVKLCMSDSKCRAALRRTVSKYGNNQYGLLVLSHLASKGRADNVTYKKARKQLTKEGRERCEIIASEPLTDKMYVVDGKEEVYSLNVNMSGRYWGLIKDYKKNYYARGTLCQVVRAATVTGLFCLSKWLLKGKISKNETDFYALYNEIEAYARTHY